MRCSVTSSKEEGKTGELVTTRPLGNADLPWVDHVIDELFAQSPHLQTDPDRDQSKENLEPPHPPDGSSESFDVLLMLGHELGREKVGPELIVSLSDMSFRGYQPCLPFRMIPVDQQAWLRILASGIDGRCA